MIADWPDACCRRQYHPQLSPLGWHLGHVFFIEAYWLQEVVCGDARRTAPWHDLFFPENAPKTGRARRLPSRAELIDWSLRIESENEACWPRAADSGHRLMQRDYLSWFLVQHYAQHLETMRMIRNQAALRAPPEPPQQDALEPRPLEAACVTLDPATVRLGADTDVRAYDNEVPAHAAALAGFRLAQRPVSNGQWLAFIRDGGYRQRALWDARGWHWLQAAGARHPQHWRPHPRGGWYTPVAGESLDPDAPVHGICWHEARAFARWAGARLPHEYEWEHAANTGRLGHAGAVWEWCDNSLHPYPGFTAFPYSGYSQPWFDGRHRVLRGGSAYTAAEIRRPSFRNFYPEGHRHVFAGLRLAWDV